MHFTSSFAAGNTIIRQLNWALIEHPVYDIKCSSYLIGFSVTDVNILFCSTILKSLILYGISKCFIFLNPQIFYLHRLLIVFPTRDIFYLPFEHYIQVSAWRPPTPHNKNKFFPSLSLLIFNKIPIRFIYFFFFPFLNKKCNRRRRKKFNKIVE